MARFVRNAGILPRVRPALRAFAFALATWFERILRMR
jgi:hypothetical protein